LSVCADAFVTTPVLGVDVAGCDGACVWPWVEVGSLFECVRSSDAPITTPMTTAAITTATSATVRRLECVKSMAVTVTCEPEGTLLRPPELR